MIITVIYGRNDYHETIDEILGIIFGKALQ